MMWADICYEPQKGGLLLFWSNEPTRDLLRWLDTQDLAYRLNFGGQKDRRYALCPFVGWMFERPIDAFWCCLRYESQQSSWPTEYIWDADDWEAAWAEDIAADLELDEEAAWERRVGPLSLGSTGGCPMWQEGPRARPLARPRPHAKRTVLGIDRSA